MQQEKVLKEAVLVFLVRHGVVLLARKSRHYGAGKWNGYGGGVESTETPRETAVREIREDTGGKNGVRVKPDDLEHAAIIHFHNEGVDGSPYVTRVHVYIARRWHGLVNETEEMLTPCWYPFSQVPYESMMPSDRDWLPYVLAGRKIIAHAYLTKHQAARAATTVLEFVELLTE